MDRRTFLQVGGTAALTATAGCIDLIGDLSSSGKSWGFYRPANQPIRGGLDNRRYGQFFATLITNRCEHEALISPKDRIYGPSWVENGGFLFILQARMSAELLYDIELRDDATLRGWRRAHFPTQIAPIHPRELRPELRDALEIIFTGRWTFQVKRVPTPRHGRVEIFNPYGSPLNTITTEAGPTTKCQ